MVRQLFTFAAQLEMIANRIDGRQDELELESESMVVVAEAGGKEEHEGAGEFEVGEPPGGEPFLGKLMVHRSLCSPSSPNPSLLFP